MENDFLNKYFKQKKSLTKGYINCSLNQTLTIASIKDNNYLKTFNVFEDCINKIKSGKFRFF